MDVLKSTVGVLAVLSPLGVAGLVRKGFLELEEMATDDLRDIVRNWLTGGSSQRPIPPRDPVGEMGAALEAVFGRRHLSCRCVLMSCVVSYLSVVGFTVPILVAFGPQELMGGSGVVPTGPAALWEQVRFATLASLLSGYLSLLETRHAVRLMSHTSSHAKRFALALLDVVASAAIFGLIFQPAWLLWGQWMLHRCPTWDVGQLLNPFHALVMALACLPFSAPHFCAALVTSSSVWLFAFLAIIPRTAALSSRLQRITHLLDLEGRPLRALTDIATLLSFLVTFTLGLIVAVVLAVG